ncbi:molybdopterin guanine dinucleotide-containing S/N-oxide reductase [Kiloniella laminariae]|uniref:Molybdopterin guanine dinucleotide-containing S/N-oxide reductase n=1 Tax=Kiloniella laminariae TaxID=454162 RepID=A0ABT4LHV5_9PROT|nr:molybdopterin guanine dinucleotide-containing S/N-oxide reductase [Kiloniella laminariae]MCZ4280671.1 molybdopterin guanine dinucleotide-containing S/N-oxide reductase [Kiloniella laminariae]
MNKILTAAHWGTYLLSVEEDRITGVEPFAQDPDPSPIGQSFIDGIQHPCRVTKPAIRKSYLEQGPGAATDLRGAEPFVEVEWDTAFDLVSRELDRVRQDYGNQAIFAGSYGWASAGRFHHAQSQIHRFLNCIGGYTKSVNTYSYAAAEVILPHVVGHMDWLLKNHTSWPVLEKHCELMVMFGGIALKNGQINVGGVGKHSAKSGLRACRDAGTKFVNFGPVRDDVDAYLEAVYHQPRPNSDVSIMLALAYTLWQEGLHDKDFLQRYCVGFERFLPYLTGESDGQAKTPEWAAGISGLEAGTIRDLALEMARKRTMVTASWSMQRGDHGEQAYWMTIVLAAMLGQIGLPGGGFGLGYAGVNGVGHQFMDFAWASLDQGTNEVRDFIPVARISDLLLKPGEAFQYNGREYRYPETKVVYWAGGNPFHHHQDINRLLQAWRKPDSIIVHEQTWNALSRHADIVLPASMTAERNDIGCAKRDEYLFALKQAVKPVGEALDDYAIFSGIAEKMGVGDKFTEGRSEMDWLRYLHTINRQRAASFDIAMPDFDAFWEEGEFTLPLGHELIMMADYRADPDKHPLKTPSGRIEIFSETVASFELESCPGHPTWIEPKEWLGSPLAKRFPLHLMSNQPVTRLHSQFDHGKTSQDSKVAGREALTMHPEDARSRGLKAGDVVRVFNDRGATLAGLCVGDNVQKGIVQLPTGAWYDPVEPGVIGSLDKSGNPNVLTRDEGTSELGQGPVAHSVLVEVERFEGEAPRVTVYQPPEILRHLS